MLSTSSRMLYLQAWVHSGRWMTHSPHICVLHANWNQLSICNAGSPTAVALATALTCCSCAP